MKLTEILDENESVLAGILERKFGKEPIYVVARFRRPFTLGRKLYVGKLRFNAGEKIQKEDMRKDGNWRFILKLDSPKDVVYPLADYFDKQFMLKKMGKDNKLVLVNRQQEDYYPYPEELEAGFAKLEAAEKT